MTQIGYDKITAEINYLCNIERPRIVEECYEAAQLGDRSENAAYIYGKRKLRSIDGRLQYLNRKIKHVKVLDENRISPKNVVDFGAIVEIEVYYEQQDDTEKSIFRLVDTEEAEATMRRVSIQSPVGAAIMGLEVGDIVDVELPRGDAEIEVLELHYGRIPKKWKSIFPDPFDDQTFQFTRETQRETPSTETNKESLDIDKDTD